MLYKILKRLDWTLLLSVLGLSSLGLIVVNSAVSKMGNASYLGHKQFIALILGILFMILLTLIDYHIYYRYSTGIYLGGIFLLILVLFIGKTVKGSRSWLDFQYFSFQPTELVKVSLVLFFAKYLDKHAHEMYKTKVYRDIILAVGLIIVLILKQPDFGSLLVFFPITFGMLLVMGVSRWKLGLLVLFGVIAVAIPLYITIATTKAPTVNIYEKLIIIIVIVVTILYLLYYFFNRMDITVPTSILVYTYIVIFTGVISGLAANGFLKDYQKNRIITFLYPDADPLGAGYNIIQSKIAVGSGGLFGKGLFSGTQIQLGFLPERHTDFIFSVIGEELGFLGSSFFILLFVIFIWRIYVIATVSRDRFGSLIAAGFLCMFGFCIIINLGVSLGLLPVTGLPLPFVSYGGSAFVMSYACVGILLNIGLKRYLNQ